MAVVMKSGLVALKNGVVEYFKSTGVEAEVSLGWTKRTRQDNQGQGQANRVVIIPADKNGKAGKITMQNVQPGDRPILDDAKNVIGVTRQLRTWERIVTLSVWACDSTDETNEDAQVEASDALLNATVVALQRAAATINGNKQSTGAANIEFGDVESNLEPVDRSFGRELLVQMTYRHPLFDEVEEMAFPENGRVNRDPES